MKKILIALTLVLAFSGVSFAADAAAPAEKPAAEAAAPVKKEKKAKKAKKAVKKDAAAAEKKAE